MVDWKSILTITGFGWLFLLLGWLIQVYFLYGKRTTRISTKSIVLMLLGFILLLISDWINGFSFLVILQILIVFFVWLVYVRRR